MTVPSLEQYPGYYPAGSKKFWTRTKVGITAGVVGLLVGMAGGGSDAPPVAKNDDAGASAVRADLEEALAKATDLEGQLQSESTNDATVLQRAERQAKVAQRTAVRAAVAQARRIEQRKAATAVKAAKSAAFAAGAASVKPAASSTAPTSTTTSSTDPRFSYCYEANDAGYGPYYQGQDPEYAWYNDSNNDGIVCES